MGIISQLFKSTPAVDYKELRKQGAKIIDVRSPGEFSQGHIQGAVNIPLQQLTQGMSKYTKDTIIITCCASGMRSQSAKGQLLNMGYTQVHNGGGWFQLNELLK